MYGDEQKCLSAIIRKLEKFLSDGRNNVSVIPFRLIVGLHEWRNEMSTVPRRKPPNSFSWCKNQGSPVGSEDPVKLYYSLLLWHEFDCIAYVGAVTSQCRQVLVRRQCNTTLLD